MSQEQSIPAEATASSSEGIQAGLAARAEAMQSIAQARESLGRVATPHEVHVDTNGVVMTDREVEEHRLMGSHDDVRI